MNLVQNITLAMLLGALLLSACTSAPTGPNAGAPSAHVPQNYETITSSAAVTSVLGGSAVAEQYTGGHSIFTILRALGTMTHDTGGLLIYDGTYLFADADGPNPLTGVVTDGNGGNGTIGNAGSSFTGTYDYVVPYQISYAIPMGFDGSVVGVVGMITDTADMPVAGSATYSGESSVAYHAINTGKGLLLENGTSTVTADFGSGIATVDLNNFSNITNLLFGNTIPAGTESFNQVQGTGLIINGAHFTGGSWATLKDGAVVNLIGTEAVSSSDGTFFGYDPSISAPDEVGGVFLITAPRPYYIYGQPYIVGQYIAD